MTVDDKIFLNVGRWYDHCKIEVKRSTKEGIHWQVQVSCTCNLTRSIHLNELNTNTNIGDMFFLNVLVLQAITNAS